MKKSKICFMNLQEGEEGERIVEQILMKNINMLQYIENFPEELQLFAVKKLTSSILYIKNPAKRTILEAFSSIYIRDFNEPNSYRMTHLLKKKSDVLLKALGEHDEQGFYDAVKEYKKELEHGTYFKCLLVYLQYNQKDWVPGFITAISPLTKEQEDTWKQKRLKALF